MHNTQQTDAKTQESQRLYLVAWRRTPKSISIRTLKTIEYHKSPFMRWTSGYPARERGEERCRPPKAANYNGVCSWAKAPCGSTGLFTWRFAFVIAPSAVGLFILVDPSMSWHYFIDFTALPFLTASPSLSICSDGSTM